MSDIAEKNSVVVPDDQKFALVPAVVSTMSKIMELKNGLNYLEWSKTIRFYVTNI